MSDDTETLARLDAEMDAWLARPRWTFNPALLICVALWWAAWKLRNQRQ